MSMRVGRIASFCLSVYVLVFGLEVSATPIGLVLSGGGAKGAYEVGVWQELKADGLASNVTAISGTSVGALNAALFATRPDAAERLWLEKMAEVFTLNTNRVAESIQRTLNDASNAVVVAEKTGKDWKGVAAFLLNSLVRVADDYVKLKSSRESRIGYIDSSKLAIALDETLPRTWHRKWPVVYATAVEKGGGGASKTWRLNDETHERRVSMLRASAAIPFGFDTVSIDGRSYVDGGWEDEGGDNVPITPILDHHPEVKTIIVVHLNDERHIKPAQRDRVRSVAEKKGVRLVEIIPSEDIGGAFGGWEGMFDASLETARRLVELGRKDVANVLKKGIYSAH